MDFCDGKDAKQAVGRSKNWTVEGYEREIARVKAQQCYLEKQLPKIRKLARRDQYESFAYSI